MSTHHTDRVTVIRVTQDCEHDFRQHLEDWRSSLPRPSGGLLAISIDIHWETDLLQEGDGEKMFGLNLAGREADFLSYLKKRQVPFKLGDPRVRDR